MRNPIKIVKELISDVRDIKQRVDKMNTMQEVENRGPIPNPDLVAETVHNRSTENLTSALCKEIDFDTTWYATWCKEMKQTPRHHRKQWEFAYILQAIYQRGLMKAGKKALGFAVGTEPLPAILAKHGVEVTATDIDPAEGTEKGWTTGDQLCFGLDSLNQNGICPDSEFKKLVHYEAVDMNNIPDHLTEYDFTWSACAFEHLGSIAHGLAFVENQMKTLKSGGWAFHSSEFNISSNTTTIETESLVLFRQKDYLELAEKLRKQGHFVEVLDFSLGWMPTDYYVDLPPYSDDKHLRLQIDRYVTSSFCLIIQKM